MLLTQEILENVHRIEYGYGAAQRQGRLAAVTFSFFPRFVTYLSPHGVKRSTVYYTTVTTTIFMRFAKKFISFLVFNVLSSVYLIFKKPISHKTITYFTFIKVVPHSDIQLFILYCLLNNSLIDYAGSILLDYTVYLLVIKPSWFLYICTSIFGY